MHRYMNSLFLGFGVAFATYAIILFHRRNRH